MAVKFVWASRVTEDHKSPLFGVKFNPFVDGNFFASVGNNQATVYKCEGDKSVTPICTFKDEDSEELFYCCEWTYCPLSKQSWLAIGGAKGIVRVIDTVTCTPVKSYVGHSSAINELKVHPHNASLILSASKDHSLRLWNLSTDVCVLLLSGVDGHRDEVLSCDFTEDGTKILSAGMDHSVKMWDIATEEVQDVIDASASHTHSEKRNFPTLRVHFPMLSSREIHTNYADCIRSLGSLVLSKACENKISVWKPVARTMQNAARHEAFPMVAKLLTEFPAPGCEVWYMRFEVDQLKHLLALGTQTGRVLLWDLKAVSVSKNLSSIKPYVLTASNCSLSTVRQVSFSPDSKHLVAVTDIGEVWRWDRV